MKMIQAALRNGRGIIVRGCAHWECECSAVDLGQLIEPVEYGFIGQDGRFYTREQAEQLTGVYSFCSDDLINV